METDMDDLWLNARDEPTPFAKEMERSEKSLEAIDDAILGKYLKEYILESNHGGWEGYPDSDMIGVNAFLKDLVTYIKNV